jgi:hypothetical protein
MTEASFRIAIPDDQIDALRQKLRLTRFPDELENAGWEYGAPLADIRRLVERWQNGYDWKEHEAQINTELPQFTRDIEVAGHGTLNIHYVHKKSEVPDAIPLIFVHGCTCRISDTKSSSFFLQGLVTSWKFGKFCLSWSSLLPITLVSM